MIVKATRVATASGAQAVGRHVLAGGGNEQIVVLAGTQHDLDAMMADAKAHGAKYGIRHYTISPSEPMTRAQANRIMQMLADEFGFSPASAVVVEHEKRRAGDAGHNRHWHLLVPEVDVISGRVLDAHYMRVRHERIARLAEYECGHALVRGAHNRAVCQWLEKQGRPDVVAAMLAAGLTQGPRPREAFSHAQHQQCARAGLSLPALRAFIALAWRSTASGAGFAAALGEKGLAVAAGSKPGIWVVSTAEGTVVGAVHRLARVPKGAVAERMLEGEENGSGPRYARTAGDLRRSPGGSRGRGEAAAAPGVAGRGWGRIADNDDPPRTRRLSGSGSRDRRSDDHHCGEGRLPVCRVDAARLNRTLERHRSELADLRHQVGMATVSGLARMLDRQAEAVGSEYHQYAGALRQIAQAIRACHEPTLAAVAARPIKGKGGSAAVGGSFQHLLAASAQPGVFAMMDGDDADAAMRFLRQWGQQQEAQLRRFN